MRNDLDRFHLIAHRPYITSPGDDAPEVENRRWPSMGALRGSAAIVPYSTVADLPPAVRRLPPHAQEIFLAAFNNAWATYADRGPAAQEETAFRVAWGAVKQRYRKRGDLWTPKARPDWSTRRYAYPILAGIADG